MSDFYDKQKENHGKAATWSWLFWGVVWLIVLPHSPGLISLAGAMFLFVGMWVAAVAVGGTTYYIQRRVANGLGKQQATDAQILQARDTLLVVYLILRAGVSFICFYLIFG